MLSKNKKTAVLLILALAVLGAGCTQPTKTIQQNYELTIPEGTYKQQDASILNQLPNENKNNKITLIFNKKDTLTVTNQDVVDHSIGVLTVRPGETLTHTFTQSGSFTGACTMLGGQEITVQVN